MCAFFCKKIFKFQNHWVVWSPPPPPPSLSNAIKHEISILFQFILNMLLKRVCVCVCGKLFVYQWMDIRRERMNREGGNLMHYSEILCCAKSSAWRAINAIMDHNQSLMNCFGTIFCAAHHHSNRRDWFKLNFRPWKRLIIIGIDFTNTFNDSNWNKLPWAHFQSVIFLIVPACLLKIIEAIYGIE